MFRFSYELNGLRINFVMTDKTVFLEKLDELARLVFLGKITNVKFY